MSRLYVTSSRTRAKRAEKACSELSTSGSYEGKQCVARSYRKPSRKEESFLRVGQDSFLAIAGTAIYDGGLGEERKEEIYELFVEGGVGNVRSKILGHYVIAVKRKGELTLFTDPLGSFCLYYTQGNGSWIASNSLHACAVSCDDLSLDATRLIATIYQSGLPADRTFYREIRRLFGSQVLRVDTAEGALHVEEHAPPTYSLPKQPSSVHEAVKQYGERVRSVFEKIAEVGEIGIMLTGGIDSRTVLAALLDQGSAPTVLAGTGDNSRRNSDEDVRIAGNISDEFGLEFRKVDWSDQQPHSRKKIKNLFSKYGFKHEVYGSPSGLVNYIKGKNKKIPRIILGGYSPLFTKEKHWNDKKRYFSVKNVIEDYLKIEKYDRNLVDIKKYKKEIKKDILRKAENKVEESKISRMEYIEMRLELRVKRDARFARFVNEFTSYIDPFRTKRLYDPVKEMNPELRRKNKLQVGLIQRMKRRLTKIDVYSGWENKSISNGYLEDKEFEPTIKDRLSLKYVRDKIENILDRHAPGAAKRAVETARRACSTIWPWLYKDYAMNREYARRLSDHKVVRQCVRDVAALPRKALVRLEYLIAGIESVADALEKRSASDSQK